MALFYKLCLSESVDGRGISVAATSSPGTLIHTAVSGTVNMDEVWLYAVANGTNTRALTVEFGGTSDGDKVKINVSPGEGLVNVIPGLILQDSVEVRAYADAADEVVIMGYVHRIVE